MKQGVTIFDTIRDKRLFGPWFKDETTWQAWFAFLAALFGRPMTASQLAIFRQCTGRTSAPSAAFVEAWLICGRRAGKSFILALVAVFLACFHDFRKYLAPGERGTVMVVAVDRKQARIILRYVRALLSVPLLQRMVVHETAEGFDLDNAITIEVHVASFRSTRGYAIVAALLDELAFWPTDTSADPDFEVINAVRSGMLQFPDALLLCASSPFARRGALWEAWQSYYGQDDDVLVWQAATRVMNPTVSQSVIDKALAKDPARAQAEYMASFRSDVEGFVSREVVEACIRQDRHELVRVPGTKYIGFADPSGGGVEGSRANNDLFTAAVAHREKDGRLVLDAAREIRPKFSPKAACAEHAKFFKSYGITRITLDRWGGDFPREHFRSHGLQCETSELTKSEFYGELQPQLNSHTVELYRHPRMISQLCDLERKVSGGGRESISHPPGGHDDIINAAAGALVLAATQRAAVGGHRGGGARGAAAEPKHAAGLSPVGASSRATASSGFFRLASTSQGETKMRKLPSPGAHFSRLAGNLFVRHYDGARPVAAYDAVARSLSDEEIDELSKFLKGRLDPAVLAQVVKLLRAGPEGAGDEPLDILDSKRDPEAPDGVSRLAQDRRASSFAERFPQTAHIGM